MANILGINLQRRIETNTCARCGNKSTKGRSFGFKEPVPEGSPGAGTIIKCTMCAIRHTPMLRRSLIVAIVVGSILTVLNQGDVILAGDWNSPLYWKIPLTFCVPFCVATYGALSNGRR